MIEVEEDDIHNPDDNDNPSNWSDGESDVTHFRRFHEKHFYNAM